MQGLLQLKVNSVPPLNKTAMVTNDTYFQRPAVIPECVGLNSIQQHTSYKYKRIHTTKRISYTNILVRCVPIAACLSKKPNLENTASVASKDVEEDSLPGVRIQKSIPDQRVNTHIGEQELNQWLEKETGMDRVRMMFSVGRDGTFIQEGTRNLNSIFCRSVFLGTVVCVATAAVHEHSRRQESQLPTARMLLQGVSKERTIFRGIMVESMKNMFKFMVFSASLLYMSQAIAAYRNKSSVWEYTIASTLGFGLLDLEKGVRRCAKMALRGAILGTVGGFVVCQVLASNGLNQEQKHLECVRHHLQEQKRMKLKLEHS